MARPALLLASAPSDAAPIVRDMLLSAWTFTVAFSASPARRNASIASASAAVFLA